MSRQDLEKLASGKIGTKQQRLWNCYGTWPDDFGDKEQNPRVRPCDYWCATVNGQIVEWEGMVGWPTKEKALEIAAKFQQKCIDVLAKQE